MKSKRVGLVIWCWLALTGLPLSASADPQQLGDSEYYCDFIQGPSLFKSVGMGMLRPLSINKTLKSLKRQSAKLRRSGKSSKAKSKKLTRLANLRDWILHCKRAVTEPTSSPTPSASPTSTPPTVTPAPLALTDSASNQIGSCTVTYNDTALRVSLTCSLSQGILELIHLHILPSAIVACGSSGNSSSIILDCALTSTQYHDLVHSGGIIHVPRDPQIGDASANLPPLSHQH